MEYWRCKRKREHACGDNLLDMSVRFAQGGRLDWLFSTQNQPEIDGVLDHLATLAPSIYLN